jgi:hypothetical protein
MDLNSHGPCTVRIKECFLNVYYKEERSNRDIVASGSRAQFYKEFTHSILSNVVLVGNSPFLKGWKGRQGIEYENCPDGRGYSENHRL